jgi:hypothetical protein
LVGVFTAEIIRYISNLRLKHGQAAVNLQGCGRFVLTEDFSNIADITYIDLSGIDSLEGTFTGCYLQPLSLICCPLTTSLAIPL